MELIVDGESRNIFSQHLHSDAHIDTKSCANYRTSNSSSSHTRAHLLPPSLPPSLTFIYSTCPYLPHSITFSDSFILFPRKLIISPTLICSHSLAHTISFFHFISPSHTLTLPLPPSLPTSLLLSLTCADDSLCLHSQSSQRLHGPLGFRVLTGIGG